MPLPSRLEQSLKYMGIWVTEKIRRSCGHRIWVLCCFIIYVANPRTFTTDILKRLRSHYFKSYKIC